jgi:mannose/cellobiose epimerase-like protein (N-acyl-D-glucosamine 2-epimerase family)
MTNAALPCNRSIEKGDMDATSHYKSRIENGQRTLRRKEADEKREWRRVFFSTVDPKDTSEQTFQQLVKMIMAPHLGTSAWEGVAPDKTAGVWRFDDTKAAQAKKPFHDEGALALGEKEDGSSAPVSRVASTATRPEAAAQAPVNNAAS